MERVRLIDHQGKQIVFIDFSSCGMKEILEIAEEAKKVIRSHPENSVLGLTDASNVQLNAEFLEAMKEYTQGNSPYIKASAVVGLSGIREVILNSIRMFTRRSFSLFDDVEEAKNWLAQQ